ncbi:hypothetical protein [Sphingomonas sp.]|uniref:hypothetical protein n=1 Tax=Sphingomonas sp. TaxID=28214 RepID=UPI0025D9BBAE|nr:hypothetical protein [Sphingomonas sp.]
MCALLLSAMTSPAIAAETAPAPDTIGSGHFPAVKEEISGLPDHVVYRPRDLGGVPQGELGVYLFGNGACSDDGASSRMHLLEIASHGYLAIAPGRIRSGPGALAPKTSRAQAPGRLSAPTSSSALAEALDWALAENERPGSPLHGKIDPKRIAVSGFSCGGLQAYQIATDPRIRTTVIMNSGIFSEGKSPIEGMDLGKSRLNELHGTVLYVLGGPTDIAYPNGTDDFRRLAHLPTAMVNIPVGHGGTYDQPNGGLAAKVVVSWLDWQLKGDGKAAAQFQGKDCGLCTTAGLTIETKRISD